MHKNFVRMPAYGLYVKHTLEHSTFKNYFYDKKNHFFEFFVMVSYKKITAKVSKKNTKLWFSNALLNWAILFHKHCYK